MATPTQTWWITAHAAKAMLARGFNRNQVLEAAANPEVTYPSGHEYPQWQTRQTRQRGTVAVIVDTERMEIITVLKREVEQWVDQP